MKEELVLTIKKFVYYYFDVFDYRGKKAIESVFEITKNEEQRFDNSKYTIGIVKEKWHLHSDYISACNELRVSYKVVDFFSHDWYEKIIDAKIDVLISRPSVQFSPWKDMFDNRLHILQRASNIKILPNVESLWLWESKLRTLEWLKLNKYPHPKSYVFYELEDLYKQSRGFNYPIVYKASSGSGSSGVRIVDNIGDLEKLAKKVFYRGIRTYRQHKLDKEFGYMILQEYLHNVKEWRIIRIGDYYFGFEKIKSGDFHSGSHVFGYGMPPIKCLEISKQITDKYKFLCISIDIFITDDSCVYINELQPYFGQKDDRELLIINDEPGRLYWDSNEKKWVFEKGEYCRNNLSNLRISEIIKKIKK